MEEKLDVVCTMFKKVYCPAQAAKASSINLSPRLSFTNTHSDSKNLQTPPKSLSLSLSLSRFSSLTIFAINRVVVSVSPIQQFTETND
ncbi:hypothetical protein K1719_044399 [Acacia pycnantha]|nr:hypothetical protein K1719_044399 [Acacia pycnantha]